MSSVSFPPPTDLFPTRMPSYEKEVQAPVNPSVSEAKPLLMTMIKIKSIDQDTEGVTFRHYGHAFPAIFQAPLRQLYDKGQCREQDTVASFADLEKVKSIEKSIQRLPYSKLALLYQKSTGKEFVLYADREYPEFRAGDPVYYTKQWKCSTRKITLLRTIKKDIPPEEKTYYLPLSPSTEEPECAAKRPRISDK